VANGIRRSGMGRSLAVILGFVLVFGTSCDKHTRIARSEWTDLEPGSEVTWEVRTSDAVYRVRRFAVTDSTMILEQISEVSYYQTANYSPGLRETPTKPNPPITLSFGEIESIKRVEPSTGRTVLLIGGVIGGVALIIYWSLGFMVESTLTGVD